MARGIPRASTLENIRFTLTYTVPIVLRGTFISEPAWMRLTTSLDANRWSAALLRRLRKKHGGQSVLVRGLTGPTLLVLPPDDIRRVLTSPAHLYSLSTQEKQNGLGMFQPGSVILSRGPLRDERRAFNESVLGTGHDVHQLAERFLRVIADEMPALLADAERYPERSLGLEHFEPAFRRVARRCVFGDAARDDELTTDLLAVLRRDANWMGRLWWTRRRDKALFKRLDTRITRYVANPEPGSLTSLFAAAPHGPDTKPTRQITQWLMAFDAIRVGIMQTLALLASHPRQLAAATEALAEVDAEHQPGTVGNVRAQDRLRACYSEGLRLWAPVPSLLRQTTAETCWYGTDLPAGTAVLIPAILHHRDPDLPYAHRFTPEAWLDGSADNAWQVLPFSKGDGQCPGRDLGLFLGVAGLAELLRLRRFELLTPALRADRPLPYTLNPQRIRFAARSEQRMTPRPFRGSADRKDRKVPSGPAAAGG